MGGESIAVLGETAQLTGEVAAISWFLLGFKSQTRIGVHFGGKLKCKKWKTPPDRDHRALFGMSRALEDSTFTLVFDRTRGEFVLESARIDALENVDDVESVAAEEVATLKCAVLPVRIAQSVPAR